MKLNIHLSVIATRMVDMFGQEVEDDIQAQNNVNEINSVDDGQHTCH